LDFRNSGELQASPADPNDSDDVQTTWVSKANQTHHERTVNSEIGRSLVRV